MAEPVPAPEARPLVLTVSTAELDVLHVAVEERFCVLPSEYVPVAVNCSLEPFGMLAGLAGVMAMELSVAAVVVAVKVLVTLPTVTVMVLAPAATPVIKPVLFTVTAEGVDEL